MVPKIASIVASIVISFIGGLKRAIYLDIPTYSSLRFSTVTDVLGLALLTMTAQLIKHANMAVVPLHMRKLSRQIFSQRYVKSHSNNNISRNIC